MFSNILVSDFFILFAVFFILLRASVYMGSREWMLDFFPVFSCIYVFYLLPVCPHSPLPFNTAKLHTVGSVCAQLCMILCILMDSCLPSSSVHGIFQGKNTGAGYQALLRGIFLIQGSNRVSWISWLAGGFFTTVLPRSLWQVVSL